MSNQENTEIVPIALPGTHQRFLEYFNNQNFPRNIEILDVGAGHGAFTKVLYNKGYKVQACDLFPEMFRFEEVHCTKADITEHLPYPDQSFDLVIAIEVLEHVNDHEVFFKEVARILKPGGLFLASTPNILSMKSRFRFLFSGFVYSFKPLELENYNGLQHVASLTIDQYNYIAVKNRFLPAQIAVDKLQKSSRWLLVILYPFLWIYPKWKKIRPIHNTRELLLGRLLFLNFKKKPEASE